MSISINWLTRVIYIPQDYLTPLGGVGYRLDIESFRNDLKNIEDSEEGIIHPETHTRNAPSILSGVTYAQLFKVINNYTITFQNTGIPYVVFPVGANHNIGDVTNFDGGMSLVIGNSAGLIVVSSSGGDCSTIFETPLTALGTPNTIGARLKQVATEQTVGEQLAAQNP